MNTSENVEIERFCEVCHVPATIEVRDIVYMTQLGTDSCAVAYKPPIYFCQSHDRLPSTTIIKYSNLRDLFDQIIGFE